MKRTRLLSVVSFAIALVAICLASSLHAQQKKKQYELAISIPPASADEPRREEFSAKEADEYLREGALAWSHGRKCVSCHTNGSYMFMRPSLTKELGRPSAAVRGFFIDQLEQLQATDRKQFARGTRAAQVVYIAAGLAEWDAHVAGGLSAETDRALRLMFELQLDSGTWPSLDCWPPFESSAYQEATVAAMAAATAPGWLDALTDAETKARVERLKKYLEVTAPPHDYGRMLLLWTSTRMRGLLSREQQQEIIGDVWKHQRKDGGWSIRTFAEPASWGRGNRAEKLRGEPDFKNPPSDGHQTGLVVIVLRDAGISADDARLQKATDWLLANQRESGRWWTRSLNTDSYHFITFSGTCYALSALAKCGKLK